MKASLPGNEAERLEALRRYRILDTPPEQQLDDITLLAAHICGTPTALISLIDADRQWFKSRVGWADIESAREISFCAHGILIPDGELVVPDASCDGRFADNPQVTCDPPHVRFYAGVPLVTEDGHALGMLCVIDRVPRTLKPEQLAALRALRRSVVVELELRRTRTELQRSMETAAGLARDLDRRVEQRTNALRDSEERFKALTAISSDWYWEQDENFRFTYVSPPASGEARNVAELYLGRTEWEVEGLEPVGSTWDEQRALRAANQPLRDVLMRHVSAESEEIVFAISADPLFDAQGRFKGFRGTGRNLDKQLRQELSLRDAQAQLRLILDSVPAAINFFNRDETIVAVNRGYGELLEKSAGDIVGRTIREAIGEQGYAAARPYLDRFFAGESVAYERRRARKDGSLRDLRVQNVPHRDAAGRIVGGFGMTTDVTDLKAAQRALEESETRFRALTVLSSDWYWEQDENFRFTYVSQLAGGEARDAAELYLGKTEWEVEGLEPVGSTWEEQRALRATRQPLRDVLMRRVGAEGEERVFAISADPLSDPQGRFKGYRGIGRNLDKQLRLELSLRDMQAQLRLILDSVPAAISYFNRDETILAVNHGFEEFVEMPTAEIIGRSVREVIGDEAYAVARSYIERAFAGESVSYERRRVRKDGTPRNLRIQHVPHRDTAGCIVGGFGFTTDVTDIKAAQSALEASEERLRAAAEAANFGIHDRNLRTGAFFISTRLKVILGYGPHDPVDHAQAMSRFHPDDRAIGIEAFTRACDPAGGGRIDVEQRIVWDNGEIRWLALHGQVHFENGRPERSLGFWVDITERKRAEDAIRRANERLATALEGGHVSIWDADLRTGEVWFSDGWAQMVGGPLGETRTTVKELRALTHPDDLTRLVRSSAEAIKGERGVYAEEHRVRTLSGEWCWMLSRGRVSERDARGRSVRMSGTNVDITDRKRTEAALAMSEARFRAVFERSNAGIAIWGIDGRFVNVNAAFCEFIGYAADDLIGKMTGEDLRLPEDSEYGDLIGKLMRGEIAFVTRDRRFRRRDASVVWGRATAAAVPGKEGQPQFFIAVVIDMTETLMARERIERINIELEERVGERTRELRDALKELDSFSYSVSHDLRAPVGAVSGFAHLLRINEAPRLTEDGKHLLGMIEQNAERMVNLIEGLLRLSYLGHGKIRRNPLSMTALAHDALRMHKSEADADIRIGELPDCDGDPVLLGQVWTNLLGNALKYSRTRNPARIEIGWDDGKQAYCVRDNGVGFDMQYAAKLFGAFERLHGEAEFEGSGIGLAIVQRIVERHGGAIWADSTPDHGATFWFTVPGASSNGSREPR